MRADGAGLLHRLAKGHLPLRRAEDDARDDVVARLARHRGGHEALGGHGGGDEVAALHSLGKQQAAGREPLNAESGTGARTLCCTGERAA